MAAKDNLDTEEGAVKTTSSLDSTLNRLLASVEKRKQAKLEKAEALPEITDEAALNTNGRGRASSSLIEQTQLSLFELEREGRFSKLPLHPESEYPTFLTRIPIFIPAQRSNQRKILDQDNALPFHTPWGEGKKHGPPLTVYDEDTLIAIGRLRKDRLIGRPHHMPVPISEIYRQHHDEDVSVHIVYCMLSEIQRICGSQGGVNDRMRLDSIKRLAATTIEFSNGASKQAISRGTNIKLFDIAWQEYFDNAVLYIQFSPLMAAWYDQEYTYLDWNVRKQLSYTGKAVHRFLSSQPKHYEIQTKKLMSTIGYLREYKKFMADLRDTMKQLEDLSWVQSWKVVGSGRSVPHKLVIDR